MKEKVQPPTHHPVAVAAREETAVEFSRRLRQAHAFPPAVRVIEEAVKAASSADPQLRLAAIQVLGEWAKRGMELMELREAAVQDREIETPRRLADLTLLENAGLAERSKSVSGYGTPEITPGLFEAFQKRVFPVYRALLSLAADDRYPQARLEAVRAIGKVPKLASTQLPLFLKLMGADDRTVAAEAERLVGSVPSLPARRLPQIVPFLKDPNFSVRAAAARLVGKMEGDRRGAVSSLRALLTDKVEVVRDTALSTIGRLGPQAIEAGPDLFRLIERERRNPFVRASALHALAGVRPALDEDQVTLVAALASQKELATPALAVLAAAAPEHPTARHAFLEGLGHPEILVRIHAVQGLAASAKALGAEHAEAALAVREPLLRLAKTGEPTVMREWALRALGDLIFAEPWLGQEPAHEVKRAAARFLARRRRDPAHAAMGELGRLIVKASPEQREFLLKALAARGPGGAPTQARDALAPALAVALGETQLGSEVDFLRSFLNAWIAGAGKDAIPTLTSVVEAAPPGDPLEAKAVKKLASLAEHGDSRPVKALMKAFGRTDMALVYAALNAVERIGPAALPEVRAGIEHPVSARAKMLALSVITDLARHAGPAEIELLVRNAGDGDPDVRGMAKQGLTHIGSKAHAHIKAALASTKNPVQASMLVSVVSNFGRPDAFIGEMIPLLDFQDEGLRRNTLYALSMTRERAAAAIPKIVPLAKSGSLDLRIEALLALSQIGPTSPLAEETLLVSLKDPAPIIRSRALFSLSPLSPRTAPAVLAAMKDPHPHVRQDAIKKARTLRPTPEIVSALVEKLGADESSSEAARAVLLDSSAPAHFLLPKAREMLESSKVSEKTKELVAEALLKHADNALSAAPALARLLEAKRPQTRVAGARVLLDLGHRAAPHAPAVLAAMRRAGDAREKTLLMSAIDRMGMEALKYAPEIPKVLEESLRGPAGGDVDPRIQAIDMIPRFTDGEKAVRILRSANRPELGGQARLALAYRLDSLNDRAGARAIWIELAQSENPYIRQSAEGALHWNP